MKHTYLYPLPEGTRFLWMVGRAHTVDLFGETGDDPGDWAIDLKISEEIGRARDTLVTLIEKGPRVCLGRGWFVPGSYADSVGLDAMNIPRTTVRLIKGFWDAPVLDEDLYRRVRADISHDERVPARDAAEEIEAFLSGHMGSRIIAIGM